MAIEAHPAFLQFNEPRQERIHRRLLLVGAGPAAFYRDGLRLLESKELESGAHFASHCAREIESAIRAVLIPLAPSERGKKQQRKKHLEELDRVVAAYELDPNSAAVKSWISYATDAELPRRTHRNALADPRPVNDGYRAFWREWEAIFDEILDRFEARFAEHLALATSLAAEKRPTSADLDRLRNDVPNNHVTLSAFFAAVNVRWLPLLRTGGYFASPPHAIVYSEGGAIGYPEWPSSALLVRLSEGADQATLELIGEIVAEVPDSDNIWVARDLAILSARVPVAIARQLATRVTPLLKGFHLLQLPELLADLAVRLAANGHVDDDLPPLPWTV